MPLIEELELKRVIRKEEKKIIYCPYPPLEYNTAISELLRTKKGQGLIQAINTQYDFLLTGGEGAVCPYSDVIKSLGNVSGEEIDDNVCRKICEHYKTVSKNALPIEMKKVKENHWVKA
ncbi:MAG: hypothetical protein V1818_04695 [Candidatus Aenigmatarchaeota archaeon]